jgi:hypothetical protein
MRNRSILIVSVLSVVALFSATSPAWAVNLGEWVPGLKADLFFTERVEYETNIFGVRKASEDVVLRSSPGFVVDYTGAATTLSAGYRAEVLHFLRHTKQDDTHHIAFGNFNYDLPRLKAGVSDYFTRTSDPPNTELTGRVESTTNALAPILEFKLTDRLTLAGNFTWTHVEVPKFAELDRNEYLYGATLFWSFVQKAQLGLGYNHGEKGFQKSIQPAGGGSLGTPNRDVTRDQFLVRLRGDLTSKISAGLNAGYEIRSANAAAEKSAQGWIAGGDITYNPTDRTRLGLFVNRSFEESTFNIASTRAPYFTTTSGTLALEQQFAQKLRANIRATAAENDYPIKQFTTDHPKSSFREDNIWGWGSGVDYDIQKWLLVGAEYSHTTRDSSFKEFKYADDKITGKITLRF